MDAKIKDIRIQVLVFVIIVLVFFSLLSIINPLKEKIKVCTATPKNVEKKNIATQ